MIVGRLRSWGPHPMYLVINEKETKIDPLFECPEKRQ